MTHSIAHDPNRWLAERVVIHSPDEIPVFADECEEFEFWSTHEMGDEFFEGVDAEAYAELPPPRARARIDAIGLEHTRPQQAPFAELLARVSDRRWDQE